MNFGQLKKISYYYTFFNVFSVIVIIQNLSIYFFPFLVLGYLKRGVKLLAKTNIVDVFAILFCFGVIISVLSTINSDVAGYFARSLSVLPNYLYWGFLLIFLPAIAKKVDYQVIFKGIFWGLIALIVYFYTLSDILGPLAMFKGIQRNAFSFILICFSGPCVYYVMQRYGLTWAVVCAVGIVVAGAFSGSRSGSTITLLTCFLTLFSNRINLVRIIGAVILVGVLIPVVLQMESVKSTIFGVNERTFNLIYGGQEGLQEDVSYILRLAQVEKGIGLFQQHPVTGIGLNNFEIYSYNIKGNFEGFEYIMYRDDLDQLDAHNSYIGLLAEGGLLVFVPFVGILLSLFIYLIVNFKRIQDFQKPFFWGMIGMAVHLYFISAIVNVFAWFLIALTAMTLKYNKK